MSERISSLIIENTEATADNIAQKVDCLPVRMHIFRIGSVDRIHDRADWEMYLSYISRISQDIPDAFWCDAKVSGALISIEYENGVLKEILTRGDGTMGCQITHNACAIANIPKKLSGNYPKCMLVYGRVTITRKDFLSINSTLQKPFSSPCSAAVSGCRSLDSRITAKYRLSFFAETIAIIEWDKSRATTQQEAMLCLQEYGFVISPAGRLCTANEVEEYAQSIIQYHYTLPVKIEGLLIKINDLESQKLLGSTSRSPRWAVAWC